MRDIVIFGPTHTQRELGLLLWDAGLPSGTVIDLPQTDVGSAKYQREHPPVLTGLKIALHGLAGTSKTLTFFCFLAWGVGAFCFIAHNLSFLFIYL